MALISPTNMKFNVIIVDDDALVLFLHKTIIQRNLMPQTIFGFKNGKEALDFIFESELDKLPLLILLDINMPVLNGWEFLRTIQQKNCRKDIFVIMVTSSINTADMERAKNFPQVIDYIEKPLDSKVCERIFQKMQCLLQNPN